MEAWKQLGSGFLLGILSIGLVLGGFALATAEDGLIPSLVPQPSPTTSPEPAYPTLVLLTPADNSNGTTPTPAQTATETPSPSPIATTTCIYPEGWVGIIVQPSDTVASIAQLYRISTDELESGNCLVSDDLAAGAVLYVPQQIVATAVVCVPRAAWTGVYTIQPGDTLYRISLLYRVSIYELQQGNCLGYSSTIFPGQRLRVPNVSTSTATFTPILPPTMTGTATETPNASPTLAETPTPEGEISPTSEISQTPGATTKSPTPTLTPAPSNTTQPSPSASPTP